MAIAREEAREAALKGRTSTTWTYARDAADAASDVWEPLLRLAYEYRSYTTPQHVLDKIEEALGDR